jgi:hypothetical protein
VRLILQCLLVYWHALHEEFIMVTIIFASLPLPSFPSSPLTCSLSLTHHLSPPPLPPSPSLHLALSLTHHLSPPPLPPSPPLREQDLHNLFASLISNPSPPIHRSPSSDSDSIGDGDEFFSLDGSSASSHINNQLIMELDFEDGEDNEEQYRRHPGVSNEQKTLNPQPLYLKP